MIQLKIKGPKKRTVINSLKCQILKDKDRFFLMRFKSLPINKKQSRNYLLIDLPNTVKSSLENQKKKYFKSLTPKRYDFLNLSEVQRHKRLYTENLEKSFLQAQSNYLSTKHLNNEDNDEDQIIHIRKKARTLETQPEENTVECSLRNYIRKHLSKQQSSVNRNMQEVEKLSREHSEKINSLKKSRKLRSNLSSEKYLDHQNSMTKLLEGTLSPKHFHVNRMSPSSNDKQESINVSEFKRTKIYENLQSPNFFQYQGFGSKINSPLNNIKSPVKRQLKRMQLKNTGAFKHSIGPWRNSGFGGYKA